MSPMAPQTSNQTQKPGTRMAYQYACTDSDGRFSDCGYLLRNHDLKELAQAASLHAKAGHGLDVPASHFEGVAKKVSF